MAKLKVNDIKPIGTELFNDSESFMNELRNDELEQAIGGNAVRLQFSPYCPPDPIKTKPNIWPTPRTPIIL